MYVYNIISGFLMVLDIPEERGLADADINWGDPNECRFPLFDFLQPFPLQWMCIVYLIMWIGTFWHIEFPSACEYILHAAVWRAWDRAMLIWNTIRCEKYENS